MRRLSGRAMAHFLSQRQFTIEWGHCDPAGIVFNGRFFEFFDWGTWSLFEAALGVKALDLAGAFGIIGIPLVDVRARFLAPARCGRSVPDQVAAHSRRGRRPLPGAVKAGGAAPLKFRTRLRTPSRGCLKSPWLPAMSAP